MAVALRSIYAKKTQHRTPNVDSPRRTITKAIIWNLIGLVMMALVGFVATGSFAVGGGMALVNAALGLSVYILYERIWAQVAWGRHG